MRSASKEPGSPNKAHSWERNTQRPFPPLSINQVREQRHLATFLG